MLQKSKEVKMNIHDFSQLIGNLPVMEQCETTKRSTWSKYEAMYPWLLELNNLLFDNNESLRISRHDIFQTENVREKLIKTIYWGYNRGMRGNHFASILAQIDAIELALNHLIIIDNPVTRDFNAFVESINDVEGIGISTYTKILYFFNISFNQVPCLILDLRLINVFTSAEFENFAALNGISYLIAHRYYVRYIERMQQLASEMGTQGENIELFLFMFGGNLKQQHQVLEP